MKKVTIFTISDNAHSRTLKEYLTSKSVDFNEIDLTSPEESARLSKKTGYTVAPQIQIGDEFIVGFDRKKLDELLDL